MKRSYRHLLSAAVVLSLTIAPAVAQRATPPSPVVTSLFAPLAGEVQVRADNGEVDVVRLSGEMHVVTRVDFSTEATSVRIDANLAHVTGMSVLTGGRYVLVGAGSTLVSVPPSPVIQIPEPLQFNFMLVALATPPNPILPPSPVLPPSPILPVFLRNFVWGAELENLGTLMSVDASLVAN